MKKYFILICVVLLLVPFVKGASPSVTNLAVNNPIDLLGNSVATISCNASISDEAGWEDISLVNATFWHSSSTETSNDDENDHYTNSSCSFGTNTSSTEFKAICSFALEYYTNPGNWTCKIRAYDSSSEGNNQIDTIVNSLLALSFPNAINFGAFSLGETSTDLTENVTNIINTGNTLIDVRLSGSNLVCTSGSIPVSNVKYSDIDDTLYSSMNSLSGDLTTLDLNIPPRTTTISTKDIFWKISIPNTGAGGSCTNSITFSAIAG